MPALTAEQFNTFLESIVEMTVGVLKENAQEDYAPMLFLVVGEQLQVSMLEELPDLPEERAGAFEEFGAYWRSEGQPRPAAVFLAAETWVAARDPDGNDRRPSENPDAWEAVFVMGRTAAGWLNATEIEIKRGAGNAIVPGETITTPYDEEAGASGEQHTLLDAFYRGYDTGL